MKFNKTSLIFLILIISVYSHNLKTEAENTSNHTKKPEYNTFLLKTELTKEQVEALIREEEAKINMKQNKTYEVKIVVQEVKNASAANINDTTLEQKIEQEIKEDALYPLHEFHVNKSEVQTLIKTPNVRFIDKLYEKKFGRFYAFLTLFLFIFVLVHYKEKIFNPKNNYMKKAYVYNYDGLNEKEYMLVKNN